MEEINLEQAFGEIAGVEPEVAPTQEAQAQDDMVDARPVEEQVSQQAQDVNEPAGFDPSVITNQMQSQSDAIAKLAESIALMNEPKVEETVYEPTEEDLIRERARKELGLDEIENRYKQQEEMLKQQNAFIEQMKQQEVIRQREQEFQSMEKEFGSIDREAIQNHIIEVGKTNPNLADALNSPEGVRMLLKQGVGAVVNKPDNITPSASGTDINTSDAVSRVLEGKGTTDDFGDLLASYAG